VTGAQRNEALALVRANHYTHLVPSGKSHVIVYDEAIVIWSLPANKNLEKFIGAGKLWELSRLWAPDGHRGSLLTEAISFAVRMLKTVEKPDVLVSYADPNAGHKGGVYKAASWRLHGRSEENRVYVSPTGQTVARRAFHSGSKSLKKAEIEALGYTEKKLPGKLRFVFPITRAAKRALAS